MSRTSIACVSLAVLSTFCYVASAQETTFVIEAQLYQIQGDISGKTSLTQGIQSVQAKRRQPDKKGPFTFFTRADLDVANLKLEADVDGWAWDAQAGPPKHGKVQPLSPLKVRAVAGAKEPSIVRVISQQGIDYLERRSDGLFELKKCFVPLGYGFEVTVNEAESRREVTLDLKVMANFVVRRHPIEGVTLNVGAPIIEEYETTISVKPDWYYGLLLSTEGQDSILIRLRVNVESTPADSEQADPER
jgi:hypothetical protein